MAFTFTKEHLLFLYSQEPELYNVKCEAYKNRTIRNKKINKITEDLSAMLDVKISAQEVQEKIGNLRTQYFQEVSKVKAEKCSGAGTDELYKPTWWCFEELHFLSETNPVRDSSSNMECSQFEDFQEQYFNDETEEELLFDGTVEDLRKTQLSPVSTPSPSTSMLSAASKRLAVGSLKKKRKFSETEDNTTDILKSAVSALNDEKEPDHIEAFGMMVVSEMRRIKDPVRLHKLKAQIFNIIEDNLLNEI